MKLVSIRRGNLYTLGLGLQEGILNVERAVNGHPEWEGVPRTMMEVIDGGEEALHILQQLVHDLASSSATSYLIDENLVEWGPCVPEPGKIICVGLNYKKHALETGMEIPKIPILFNKFNNSVSAHQEPIRIPKSTKEVDYEVELAI